VINRTFPVRRKKAYRYFAGCGHFGRVVMTHG